MFTDDMVFDLCILEEEEEKEKEKEKEEKKKEREQKTEENRLNLEEKKEKQKIILEILRRRPCLTSSEIRHFAIVDYKKKYTISQIGGTLGKFYKLGYVCRSYNENQRNVYWLSNEAPSETELDKL